MLVQFGYYVKYKVLDLKLYLNVPQQRRRIFIVVFLDYEKCNAFKYTGEIKLTTTLNDIIDRHEKHDDFYYYTDNSFYYNDLCKIVTDKECFYKITDAEVSKYKYRICPTLTAIWAHFI